MLCSSAVDQVVAASLIDALLIDLASCGMPSVGPKLTSERDHIDLTANSVWALGRQLI